MKINSFIVIFTFALDQFSKLLVQKYISYQREIIPIIGNFFRLRHIKNRGGAFGLLSNIQYREEIFILISLLALGILFYLFLKCPRENKIMQYALALISGGALGNLYDRVFHHQVIDFLDVGLGYRRWPTFNIADIAITLGVIFIFLETFGIFKSSPAVPEQSSSETSSNDSH